MYSRLYSVGQTPAEFSGQKRYRPSVIRNMYDVVGSGRQGNLLVRGEDSMNIGKRWRKRLGVLTAGALVAAPVAPVVQVIPLEVHSLAARKRWR